MRTIRLLLLFFLCSIIHFTFAQVRNIKLISYRKGSLFGYSDSAGNIIVPPIYDEVSTYVTKDELGRITLNGKTGFVSCNGGIILKPEYKDIINHYGNNLFRTFYHYFNAKGDTLSKFKDLGIVWEKDSFFIVSKNNKFGTVDRDGNIIENFILDEVRDVHAENTRDYQIIVKQNNTFGVIKPSGMLLLFPSIENIFPINQSLLFVQKNNKDGILNNMGDTILPINYKIGPNRHGILILKRDSLFGFFHINSLKITAPKYKTVEFYFGYNKDILVQKEIDQKVKYGYVDSLGREFIPCQYDLAFPFIDELALVYIASKKQYFYINRKNEIVIDPQKITKFGSIGSFNDGVAVLNVNNHASECDSFKSYYSSIMLSCNTDNWIMINKSGEILKSFNSDNPNKVLDTYFFMNGFAEYEKDGKKVVANNQGKTIIESQDAEINIKDKYVIIKKNNKYGLVDSTGKYLYDTKYEDIDVLNDSLFALKENEKWVIVNHSGIITSKYKFDNISTLHFDFILTENNGKKGVLNNLGEIILEPLYNEISIFNSWLIYIHKKGFMNIRGRKYFEN